MRQVHLSAKDNSRYANRWTRCIHCTHCGTLLSQTDSQFGKSRKL